MTKRLHALGFPRAPHVTRGRCFRSAQHSSGLPHALQATQGRRATYFFTIVTECRRPMFRDATIVATFEQTVAAVRSRHPFEVDASVILPDHLHILWILPRRRC